MITISYVFTKEDYLNYSYYVGWGQPGVKFNMIKTRVLSFILLLFLLINLDKKWNLDWRYIGAFISLLALFYILPLFLVRYSLQKQVNKLSQNHMNEGMFTECTITFSEIGLLVKNDLGELNRKWKGVVKKSETKDYFFLFISSVQAVVIPKRVFKTKEEIEEFKKLLLKYLSFDAEIATHLKD